MVHHHRILERTTRRCFLGAVAGIAVSPVATALAQVESKSETHQQRLALGAGRPRSRVVGIKQPGLWGQGIVHPGLLREALGTVLARACDVASAADAWHQILAAQDVVGIKFNRSGQRELGTTREVGAAIIESLVQAGWSGSRIVLIEAPEGLAKRYSVESAREGYRSQPTDFGSGSDNLAGVLDQVTAIVNVPFLKTHNLCAMTCCLKNLSHAMIKHPARFHADGCSPFIADIVALPEIKDKLRLNIVDAIRVVHEGGPLVDQDHVSHVGAILASTDPVAADAVGFQLLNAERERVGLPLLASTPQSVNYLAAAHRRELGTVLMHGIELQWISR